MQVLFYKLTFKMAFSIGLAILYQLLAVNPATAISKKPLNQINVTGTVSSSSDGLGLPGANILIKGTFTGTVTDIDGHYSLNVPNETDTLVFSSLGYVTQVVAVNGRTTIDIVL